MVAPRLHDAQVLALKARQRASHGAHADGPLGGDQHHAHVGQQRRRVAQRGLPQPVLAPALQAPAGGRARHGTTRSQATSKLRLVTRLQGF